MADTSDEDIIGEAVKAILTAVGEDPGRDGLQETWQRRAPAKWEELTEGYREEHRPEMKTFPSQDSDMVTKTGIPFQALCQHHLLPFHGTAHVAYIPDGEIVGVSKLVRYARWRARRIQTQEQFTQDLVDGIAEEIGAAGVMAVTDAEHLCETMRGVQTATTTTVTAATGVFEQGRDDTTPREEFLAMLDE